MNLLTMEHVTKAYTDRVLLDDVAFGINENEKIGVIGINGMGKSTLLKIVAGVEEYDSGNLSMGNTVKICYLPQTPVFGEEETVLQAAVRGIISDTDQWMMEAEAKSMLNQLGFSDYEEKMSHMSGGQKKRVALVNALLTPADILVLDEPTNHLDNAMSEWLEEYLIRFRGAILMVTHDRYFLDRVANRIVEVDHGNLYNYPGSYSEFVKLKEELPWVDIPYHFCDGIVPKLSDRVVGFFIIFKNFKGTLRCDEVVKRLHFKCCLKDIFQYFVAVDVIILDVFAFRFHNTVLWIFVREGLKKRNEENTTVERP